VRQADDKGISRRTNQVLAIGAVGITYSLFAIAWAANGPFPLLSIHGQLIDPLWAVTGTSLIIVVVQIVWFFSLVDLCMTNLKSWFMDYKSEKTD
jgi:hypothetical protein